MFKCLFDDCFPLRKNQKLFPCVNKRITKSSKREQKLYEKFLKKCTTKNGLIIKHIRTFLKVLNTSLKKGTIRIS